jgi:hypothetical protein
LQVFDDLFAQVQILQYGRFLVIRRVELAVLVPDMVMIAQSWMGQLQMRWSTSSQCLFLPRTFLNLHQERAISLWNYLPVLWTWLH